MASPSKDDDIRDRIDAIAHDIHNYLHVVSVNVDVLRRCTEDGEARAKLYDSIEKARRLAGESVRQLHEYAQRRNT